MQSQRAAERKEVEPKKTHIFLVDDHPVVRHGIVQLITAEEDLEVVGEASGQSEALAALDTLDVDLILVDISLAEGSGLELLQRLQVRDADTKVLVVSMHDETLLAERCLEAGAMGYVNKQEATELLIEAVRRVLEGKIYLSPAMTERLLSQKATGKKRSTGLESLSYREVEIFELIGQALSTRQIASQLHVSVKTVETHRENIKRKLGLDSNLALIRHAMEWRLLA